MPKSKTWIDSFESELLDHVKRHEKAIAKFNVEFAENPHKALVWSGSTFCAVAEAMVFRTVLECISNLQNLTPEVLTPEEQKDRLLKYLVREALQRNSLVSLSSSPTSNLMEFHYAKAWAKAANFNGIWL